MKAIVPISVTFPDENLVKEEYLHIFAGCPDMQPGLQCSLHIAKVARGGTPVGVPVHKGTIWESSVSMGEQSQSGRLKTEMSQPADISVPVYAGKSVNRVLRGVGAAALVLVLCLVGIRWFLRAKPSENSSAAPIPQIEVPSPAADPNAMLPHASEAQPAIATLNELTKPWSTKQFFYRNSRTGDNVPALLVRLPVGSLAQPAGYWAFSMKAPFGNCGLEYIHDLKKLRADYGFRAAAHPMVGNPCSRTLFDPLKIMNLPGNVFVRGAIVQGSDERPPLGIELKVAGKEILAVGME